MAGKPVSGVSVLLLAALVAGCGQDAGSIDGAPTSPGKASSTTPLPSDSAAPTATEEPPAKGTAITSAASPYGPILWGPNGKAIYIWEREPSSTPTCYDDCADAWPPVLTRGEPVAAGAVDGERLGTTERRDGSRQVTYAGHPLYYYAHEAPGEVKCHDVATHGGLWWVITPEGQRAD